MIFLCGDVLNCQVLSDSMDALWVAAQNAEIQCLFFRTLHRASLRRGRVGRSDTASVRRGGAEALVWGPGEMAKGVPGRAPPCRDKTVGYVRLNQCRVSGRGVPEGCYFTAYFLPFTM